MNDTEILELTAKVRDLATYKAARVVARETAVAHRAALALYYEAYKDSCAVDEAKKTV